MADEKHLELLRQGVEAWNQWRQANADVRPDLSGANLSRVELNRADLRLANFSGADLSEAKLLGVDLNGANLSKARLAIAHLDEANLGVADLRGADLFAADLVRAQLNGANLSAANLSEAYLNEADLSWANLTDADLFETVLTDAVLYGADLSRANFSGAEASRASLMYANLSNATIRSAILRDANLSFANLSGAQVSGTKLSGANLTEARFTGADLSEADLSETRLLRTVFDKANLANCSIFGISAWDLSLEGTVQTNLVITPGDQPAIAVDKLEVAQFIYLLLNREKLRDVINSVTKRGVLILGRFGEGGLDVLRAVAAALRDKQYLPIIFDFAKPTDRNYTETVKTLVGLSRFVIVDLSGPSVPQELYATVPHFKIPFVPILEEGKKSYALFADLLEYPWVLKPVVRFTDVDSLIEQLPAQVIAAAEQKCEERSKLVEELFGKRA